MRWESFPYVLPIALAALLSIALARAAWRRRPAPGAVPLALLMLAVAAWSLGYAIELGSPDLPGKLFFAKVQYVGIATIPLIWLAFALDYTGRGQWLTGRVLAVLAAVPVLTLLLVWTNEAHGLIWSAARLDTSGSVPQLSVSYGIWFWVYVAYGYLLLLLSTAVLIRSLFRSSFLYRGQVAALLVATFAPWVGNLVYLARLSPIPNLDLTPFGFVITGLALTWGLYRHRLLDIVPVAHDAVIRNMIDGILVLDPHRRVISLNPAAERITGSVLAEVAGRRIDQILPESLGLVVGNLDPTQAKLERTLKELTLKINGEPRFFDVQISPLHGWRGRFSGWIIVLRDITERKQAEERHWQLLREQAARAETEASVRARNEVLSSLSHDLKNPLTGIRTTGQFLQRRLAGSEREDSARLIEGLARIDRMANRLAALLDELAEVARLEMGQPIDLERRPTDLIVLARRIVAEQAAATGRASLRVETTLPELVGDWDAARLERVITNLVANAIKYSPDGGDIVIRLTQEADAAGRWAVLAVWDNGLGIPAASLPRIFDRFYRAENVVGQIPGTGIGLASARQIVDQHGGTISVASHEGVGSTFTVRLPLGGDRGSGIGDQGSRIRDQGSGARIAPDP